MTNLKSVILENNKGIDYLQGALNQAVDAYMMFAQSLKDRVVVRFDPELVNFCPAEGCTLEIGIVEIEPFDRSSHINLLFPLCVSVLEFLEKSCRCKVGDDVFLRHFCYMNSKYSGDLIGDLEGIKGRLSKYQLYQRYSNHRIRLLREFNL